MAQEIRTLLGAKGLDFSIFCLDSLLKTSCDKVVFAVHGDGSLGAAEIERMQAAMPGAVRVVSSEEADDVVEPHLRAYPRLRAFRRTDVYARKLIDVALCQSGERVRFTDSDIFFLRPFTGLFTSAAPDEAMFMQDRFYSYSFALRPDLRQLFPLPRLMNSGLFDFPLRHFDLDVLDHVFKAGLFAAGWTDQTLWAVLASRIKPVYAAEVVIPLAGEAPGEAIAWHLVSRVRSAYAQAQLSALAAGLAGAPPRRASLRPFETTHVARYVAHHLQHAVRWRVQRARRRRAAPA